MPIPHRDLTDEDGDRLRVFAHGGGLYVTVNASDATRTAGPFTRAQLDEALDGVAPTGRSTGPDVHYGGYHRSDDYPQGGLVQALPERTRQYLAAQDEQRRLGRLVEGVREDGCPVQVDRVKIAPCDTRGRTRDEVAAQLQLDQEKKRHIATEQDRDELVDVQRHLTAHRAFTGCTDEDRPLLPAMLDRLDTLVEAEQPSAVTGEMVERAQGRGRELLGVVWDHEVVEAMIVAALTDPPARSDEDAAADRLRELLDAYHDQDIHAVDHEGRMSVYLARHGARVEGD